MTRILVTSALPYANGPLHFGHIAGAYLPADSYARFRRLQGDEVLYICGSDEYGVAITLSAELANRTPEEHVDHFHKINKELFNKLDFSFDHFSRTTWPKHKESVQEFFFNLQENGYIEEKEEDHLFSEKEDRFLADRYVVGICPKCNYEKARGDECPSCGAYYEAKELKEPKSKMTGSPLVLKKSLHWYLKFDMFKERLKKWLGEKEWKANVMHFTQNYLKDLRPRAITRDAKWGIPVPLDKAKNKVFYVWFDAPIGYISATKEWAEITGGDWKKFWLDQQTKHVQFIGKDNIPFHALFFPAMLMGQKEKYKLVDDLPANEFLLLEGRQFSKSEGWSIDLERFFSSYTSDQIRYYLAANAPESHDAEFCWKEFQNKCNSDLLGKWGNFVHRTLVFADRFVQGKVPENPEFLEVDKQFIKEMKHYVQKIAHDYDRYSLRKACESIMALASAGNSYFDYKKPWQLNKEGNKQGVDTTIFCCLQCIKLLALASFPIIPQAAEKTWSMLGYDRPITEQNWHKEIEEDIAKNQSLQKPQVLFQKIEDSQIEEEVSLLGSLA